MFFNNMSNKQYYRLSPTLWDSVPGQHSATVYGIDRMPDGPMAKYVTCCPRCKEDPAYYWAGNVFMRLIMPPGLTSVCLGPQDIFNAVVYSQIPVFLSWAQGQGYTLPEGFQFSKISPYDDITLIYES